MNSETICRSIKCKHFKSNRDIPGVCYMSCDCDSRIGYDKILPIVWAACPLTWEIIYLERYFDEIM